MDEVSAPRPLPLAVSAGSASEREVGYGNPTATKNVGVPSRESIRRCLRLVTIRAFHFFSTIWRMSRFINGVRLAVSPSGRRDHRPMRSMQSYQSFQFPCEQFSLSTSF